MAEPKLRDLLPSTAEFRDAVFAGLSSDPKTLPTAYLYDETGARLFEAICTLDEYYPTRTEIAIMRDHAAAMARELGPRVRLVEPGAGALTKVRYLLAHLDDPVDFVPIDISIEQLENEARILAKEFPELPVHPVAADFTEAFALPPVDPPPARTVIYYPGSTIGNFLPEDQVAFLLRMRELIGSQGALLVGVDLYKDLSKLLPAYDDAAGVTAAFTKNLLARINRELDGTFDTGLFEHRASFEAEPSRVVLEAVSSVDQTVEVAGRSFHFAAGEAVRTEYSHKPTLEAFAKLAGTAGLLVRRVWTDEDDMFSVQLLEPAS